MHHLKKVSEDKANHTSNKRAYFRVNITESLIISSTKQTRPLKLFRRDNIGDNIN